MNCCWFVTQSLYYKVCIQKLFIIAAEALLTIRRRSWRSLSLKLSEPSRSEARMYTTWRIATGKCFRLGLLVEKVNAVGRTTLLVLITNPEQHSERNLFTWSPWSWSISALGNRNGNQAIQTGTGLFERQPDYSKGYVQEASRFSNNLKCDLISSCFDREFWHSELGEFRRSEWMVGNWSDFNVY